MPDAVESFVEARKARPRWIGVPDSAKPASLDEAYRLQKAVAERLERLGIKRAGYKVGSTSAALQKAAGISEPIYAGIFADTKKSSLDEALPDNLIAPLAECEIAVILRSDLDARAGAPTAAQVTDAIGSCHIACEIVDNRYGDPKALGLPTVLVDEGQHSAFVIGEANAKWPNLSFKNLAASIEINGSVVKGNSDDVLDPIGVLQWLAQKLARIGTSLRAGDIVITGSVVAPTKLTFPVKTFTLSIEGFSPMRLVRP